MRAPPGRRSGRPRSWQTPVLASQSNMLSAVSGQGMLRFMLHDGTVTAKVFIEFCKRLLKDAGGPVFLIVDGHPSHRVKAVAKLVAATDGALRCSSYPATHPSSTRTNGHGGTSRPTASARSVSPAKTA
jgi:hypothetical protein